MHGHDAALYVLHQQALGDLEIQIAGFQTGFPQDLRHHADHAGTQELAGRKVHRHAQRRQDTLLPGFRLFAGGSEYPLADTFDQAGFLRQGNEIERRDQPALGMLPAQQGLDTDDAALAQIQLRLVIDLQFLTRQGMAQALFHGQPFQAAGVHVVGVELDIVAAALLGPIHRRVGVSQQGFDIAAILGKQADADARGDHTLIVANLKRCFEHRQQLVREVHDAVFLTQVLQHADEFVTTDADDGVVLATTDQQPLGDGSQQGISGAMAQALVDFLELIQVDEQQSQALAGSARARRTGQSLALLFVDLDQFKKINEGLGHSAGDALLRAVAERLLVCGRKDDTIVRVGSDEFICMLEDLRQEDRVVDFAHKLLTMLETPFQIGNNECVVTASIGICLFPKDGGDVETLLRNADTAMYRAKESGRNNIQFYAHDMHARSLERLTMEQGLRHALARQELEIYYQPQLDLRQGRIIGVEALLRWQHPQRGLISPLDFVPLAEETGLIESIGEWVLRTACKQAKTWQQSILPTLRMAVNLSPRQFLRPGMVSMVAQILRETGLEPRYLDLEITESLLMKDVQGSIMTMHALKAIGVRLSIDDFGTGYSSLNYLKQFPIDQLKIDKSFVHDLVVGKDDAAITLAIIAMAHSMSLTVIAEGVESEAQGAFLRANHCDEIQGYHLSRPLPADEIPALLRLP